MDYALAKELKDAGFPQEGKGDFFEFTDGLPPQIVMSMATVKKLHDECAIYRPTLEELIEACGEKFDTLRQYGDRHWAAFTNEEDEYGNRIKVAGWSSPTEAMAHLWLYMHPKTPSPGISHRWARCGNQADNVQETRDREIRYRLSWDIMTHIEQAIKDAMEKGGYYGGRWLDFWKFEDINRELYLRTNADWNDIVPVSAFLLHPLFWQALGKARRWTNDSNESFNSGLTIGQWEQKHWKTHWHRFIDHLADGKDAESFFATLV